MPLSRHSSVLHRLANPFGKIFRYTLRFRSCGFSRGAGCCLVPLRCNAGIWEITDFLKKQWVHGSVVMWNTNRPSFWLKLTIADMT